MMASLSKESLIWQNDGAASQTGSAKARSHVHEPPRPVERINGPGLITNAPRARVRVVTVNNSEPCGLVPGVNTRPGQTMGHKADICRSMSAFGGKADIRQRYRR